MADLAGPGKPGPNPPYPAGLLQEPISRSQYNEIIAWYVKVMPSQGTAAQWHSAWPYSSASTLQSFIDGYNAVVTGNWSNPSGPGPTIPGGPTVPGVPGAPGGPTSKIPNPLHAINSVVDFLKLLADPHTWLRVAEGIIGVGLILVGVAVFTKGEILK